MTFHLILSQTWKHHKCCSPPTLNKYLLVYISHHSMLEVVAKCLWNQDCISDLTASADLTCTLDLARHFFFLDLSLCIYKMRWLVHMVSSNYKSLPWASHSFLLFTRLLNQNKTVLLTSSNMVLSIISSNRQNPSFTIPCQKSYAPTTPQNCSC